MALYSIERSFLPKFLKDNNLILLFLLRVKCATHCCWYSAERNQVFCLLGSLLRSNERSFSLWFLRIYSFGVIFKYWSEKKLYTQESLNISWNDDTYIRIRIFQVNILVFHHFILSTNYPVFNFFIFYISVVIIELFEIFRIYQFHRM